MKCLYTKKAAQGRVGFLAPRCTTNQDRLFFFPWLFRAFGRLFTGFLIAQTLRNGFFCGLAFLLGKAAVTVFVEIPQYGFTPFHQLFMLLLIGPLVSLLFTLPTGFLRLYAAVLRSCRGASAVLLRALSLLLETGRALPVLQSGRSAPVKGSYSLVLLLETG
jgi:hypothetical protein